MIKYKGYKAEKIKVQTLKLSALRKIIFLFRARQFSCQKIFFSDLINNFFSPVLLLIVQTKIYNDLIFCCLVFLPFLLFNH
ncbi:hypothetical protein AR687_08545 [Flavobacteriaceae bacterium CRH]|nr:hypothetical protein AR687_08545 [Flavobacteriaceae bacterium CRH]